MCEINDMLVAPSSGTIQRSRWSDDDNNYIVLATDDGWVIPMAHMATAPSVSVGQRVSAGERVGTQENTGKSFGKRLHLEIESSGAWAYHSNLQDPRQSVDLNNYGGSTPPPPGDHDVDQNGSTRESIYSTWSSCNAQGSDYIGYIDPYEVCSGYGVYEGNDMVVYHAGSTKRAGFVNYNGGNSNPYWQPRPYANGFAREPVYRSLADAQNQTNLIGSPDPRGGENRTCVKIVDGKPLVLYTAGNTPKVGFVNYVGGVGRSLRKKSINAGGPLELDSNGPPLRFRSNRFVCFCGGIR